MNIIELSDISLEQNGRILLKSISWAVRQGEHWMILGANGAGKTLLLNVINGYMWPSSGAVSVAGKAFGEYDLRELRKLIGYVSSYLQEQLYRNEKALDVVVSGKFASIGLWEYPLESDYDRARKVMEEWNCLDFSERPYRTLSQGEKQKLLICRALMSDPILLILDEPCVALDIRAREQVLSMIQELGNKADGPTLLFVSHHVEEVMPVFSHTIILKNGRILAAGKKKEILTGEVLSEAFDFGFTLKEYNERYHAVIK